MTIELTDEDAELFKVFQQHYDIIKYMAAVGCFEIRRGDFTVHFDREGKISSIERRLFSYQ
jgi:hypothetical protein